MRCKSPSGPLRHKKIETHRPTTTGGSAMPVLMRLRKQPFPRNSPKASQVPNGSPITRLIPVAIPDTCSESRVICQTSGSPCSIRRRASTMPSQITSMGLNVYEQ